MKAGPRLLRAGTVSRKSVASASSVLGGKNSNEMVGSGRAYSWGTRKRSYLPGPPGHWAEHVENSYQVYKIVDARKMALPSQFPRMLALCRSVGSVGVREPSS